VNIMRCSKQPSFRPWHTAATLLLAQGVDPRTIMETLGRSQISLTMNTYSQVLPALQADAAAKLDTVLSKG
jgi:integrase